MSIPPLFLFTLGLAGIARLFHFKDDPKSVFISYYSKGDSHYKNLIVAWANNNKFDLKIEDESTGVNIKSDNESYIKRKIKERIGKANNFIVFVGEDTHERDWVEWEIEQAKKLCKNIIAIKEKRHFKSPPALLGCEVTWVYGFTEHGLRKALN
ncbi:TIR domain-containing protein [Pseudoalteromonas sp. MMG012]|uniref:TIR domain-containing protein n=1 Tax=Pseudoalteromonas sp. MMG012 TaxID=2822686 RepID=UPI001B3A04F6|nr:TIR domain-containing protein [Pseudoalteromonas sp. MMG012]MBQ4851403.1 TIR domain-containing protein [Pseudoalteromonas sp. MMG012]